VIVYRSLSNNIYANLALETWLLDNVSYLGRRVLLLWRNEPSVVVGRFQNPWMEADFEKLRSTGTKMARRRSGGGAVYHDMGNLNCTFFAHKMDYNRHRNLQLVADAVNNNWGVGLYVGQRNDILCKGKKVSGSAARVGKDHTYHHFTLLIDTDKVMLDTILQPNPMFSFASTTATQSIPSETLNIKTLLKENEMQYDDICKAIAAQFYESHDLKDKRHHQMVDIEPFSPTGSPSPLFPGISELEKEFKSVQWIWDKTPKFNVTIGEETMLVENGIITESSDHSIVGINFREYITKQ
ncbi:PREDICTED: lipoyltransferase 1, mitochondrial-like, partial [Amphimedon queenslandica]|uniref:BPL/LPL catalytic domain-containing protein n=1 Tax=Amphimedon queenslandica TaxID=400682 RepID=A0A1X7SSB2_AMPQE